MKLQEFDLEFDILYNNINSGKAPGINALEKSILLTQAQDFVVQNLYSRLGFENDESVMQTLSPLVTSDTYTQENKDIVKDEKDKNRYLISKPQKISYIVYESAKIKNGCSETQVDVLPVKSDDFNKVYRNPFRGCTKLRVLRLLEEDKIVIVSKYDVTDYYVKYIRRPKNIVLEGATKFGVDGYKLTEECELPSSIHRTILYKAIELAKEVWK